MKTIVVKAHPGELLVWRRVFPALASVMAEPVGRGERRSRDKSDSAGAEDGALNLLIVHDIDSCKFHAPCCHALIALEVT